MEDMEEWPKMEPHSVDYEYDNLKEFYQNNNYEDIFPGYKQSVTLHAQMDSGNPTEGPGTEIGWFLWGITAEQLPILIGVTAGGIVLVMTMIGLLLWRCCQDVTDTNKSYYLQQSVEDLEGKHAHGQILQSESAVFLSSTKPGSQAYQSCLVDKGSDVGANVITRSQSAPVKDHEQGPSCTTKKAKKMRPMSQPLQFNPSDASFAVRHVNAAGLPPQLVAMHLPEIPEMSQRSCDGLDQYSLYASSSVLDETSDKTFPHAQLSEAVLKTRSLPAWVRARPRPLSTEDDLSDLYAKVSFSKKRKNRMRNDSAAAIALNKSRSQFIQFPFVHKDTDSLVDNEAVVVYDERTAL
uniref:Uncharacterized protein n=1 Tax=Strigamia maritima TaxID=126957 RepID=T1IR06_STRMM